MSRGWRAELLVGLHVHAIGAIVEIEIVDVGRAHVNLQRVVICWSGTLQAARFLAVDLDHELRIVGGERAEQTAAGRAASCHRATSFWVTS